MMRRTQSSTTKDEVILRLRLTSVFVRFTLIYEGGGVRTEMAVMNSEVDFDDPTYMRIADVRQPTAGPTVMKKSGTIYSDLDESWTARTRPGHAHLAASSGGVDAGEVIASREASVDLKGATKQEDPVCCGQIDLGIETDSDSEAERSVTGPQVIRQQQRSTVLTGEEADAAIPVTPQRRVVSMAFSEDMYRSGSFFDNLSPDFRIAPYPPALFGYDGFAPVNCGDNPFDPSSRTILNARDRDELEESLRDFADSLVRSEAPPSYCKLGYGVSWAALPVCACSVYSVSMMYAVLSWYYLATL